MATLATLFLAACAGGEKKEKEEEKKSIKIEQKKTEEKTDANLANLVITGDDLMKFNKDTLKVKAGQKVKLTLRHIGKLDVNVMGHNVVILKQGVDVGAFAQKAALARDNGYIPEGSEDQIIAKTEMIGGGQTTVVEFTAPAVGTYEFFCSFPAHFAMMRGKFIVEE